LAITCLVSYASTSNSVRPHWRFSLGHWPSRKLITPSSIITITNANRNGTTRTYRLKCNHKGRGSQRSTGHIRERYRLILPVRNSIEALSHQRILLVQATLASMQQNIGFLREERWWLCSGGLTCINNQSMSGHIAGVVTEQVQYTVGNILRHAGKTQG